MRKKVIKHNYNTGQKDRILFKVREMVDKGKKITETVAKVAIDCECSENTIWRWLKLYDGTFGSLANKPKINKTPNKKAPTKEQQDTMQSMLETNAPLIFIYQELVNKCGYTRKYESLAQYIRRHNRREVIQSTKYEPKKYNTPILIGEKCQMDIKYVPRKCYINYSKTKVKAIQQLYEYAIIDEADRKVFARIYERKTAENTCDFVKQAIEYLGYIPKIVQTDNGKEFTNRYTETDKQHPLDILCNELGITHKLIPPATPRQNGKIERFNGLTQQWFYNNITYTDIEDLQRQLDNFIYNYNNKIPKTILKDKNGKLLTPCQKEQELISEVNYYKALPPIDFIITPDGIASKTPNIRFIPEQQVA